MTERKKIFPSLLIAIYLEIGAINHGIYVMLDKSFMQYIYIIIGILSVLTVLINMNKIEFDSAILGVASVLACCYFISYGKTEVEPLYFTMYVIFPAILSLLDFDKERVIRYSAILVVPFVFLGDDLFALSDTNDTISMGITYAFLISSCAAIVHYKYYRKEQSKYMYIVYFVNLYYLIQIIQFGSRGPILAIALLIVCMSIFDYDTKGRIKGNSVWAFFLIIITIVVVMNYVFILGWIQKFFSAYDISFEFIDKIIRLSQKGNVSNGRMYLYELSLKGFIRAPIIGHGISTFARYTNQVYPHNAILQLMFDGGIVLTSIVMGITISRSIKNLKNTDLNGFVFYLFLFFISVPTSMVTGDLFRNYSFWFFVFMTVNKRFMKKDESEKIPVGMIDSPY